MLGYKHIDNDDNSIELPVGKVVCVGRNYLQHVKELENEIPSSPLLFIKPSTALHALKEPVQIPKELGPCHNELEVAILIKNKLSHTSEQDVEESIWGIGLGLDLTLREVQSTLKKQGHPWERAKAFDRSCPMSPFVSIEKIENLSAIDFSLSVNNKLRQQGNTQEMLFSIKTLLSNISHAFTLLPGDIVMTGTPKGVASLNIGDELIVDLHAHFSIATNVI